MTSFTSNTSCCPGLFKANSSVAALISQLAHSDLLNSTGKATGTKRTKCLSQKQISGTGPVLYPINMGLFGIFRKSTTKLIYNPK